MSTAYTTYFLILGFISIVVGLVSYPLARQSLTANELSMDGYKPVSMGLLAGSYMFVVGTLGVVVGWPCVWGAIVVLAVWVWFVDLKWTSVTVMELIPLIVYGFWLTSVQRFDGAAPSGNPLYAAIIVIVIAIVSIIIDYKRDKSKTAKAKPLDVLRAVFYIVAIIALAFFIAERLFG